jgi:putative nicotinate phosphoribosyltransferase
MAFDNEDDAFRAFLRVFPQEATLLVDTYDTVAAVERLARDFEPGIAAVRLDSGDILELSKRVRQILDAAGMSTTKIFASGDLDEYRIADLLAGGARVDGFGVGTRLATSFDAPSLGGVYKLVGQSHNGRTSMRMKLSPDKATYPGAKQIWRIVDERACYVEDVIALTSEAPPTAERDRCRPLVEKVMASGRLVDEGLLVPPETASEKLRESRLSRLESSRRRSSEELRRLSPDLLNLDAQTRYPVRMSERLEEEKEKLRGQR